jgi:acetyl-CoA carboxylase biotin carboxyl carrier protein
MTGGKRPIEDGMTKQPHDSDVAFIQALAELLNANELTELNVKREYGENDSLNVRVSKQSNVVMTQVAAHAAPSSFLRPKKAWRCWL